MIELNSIGYSTTIVSILFTTLATVAVAARFYTRARLNNGQGLDDWLIALALLFYYAYVVDTLFGVFIYTGIKDSTKIPLEDLIKYLKTLYFLGPSYAVAISFVKFSILSFYGRLFTVGSFPRISGFVGLICLAWFISGFVAGLLYCIPMKKFWDPSVSGHCYNFNNFFLAMEVINLVLDVVILALPLKMISGLHLPSRKKVAIGGIFLLGGFVCVTGIVRIKLVYQPKKAFVSFTQGALWTSIQLGVAIICACLPTYGPLWTPIKTFGSSLRHVYSSFLGGGSRSRAAADTNDSGNGIPSTNSYYKRVDNSNRDHVHLTHISGSGFDKESLSSKNSSPQGIRVQRDVDVV